MRKPANLDKLGRLGAETTRSPAIRYARDPHALAGLIERAQRKVAYYDGALTAFFDELMLLLRMLRAYIAGTYRAMPWQTLVLICAALVYFVLPTDLIPDALFHAGFLDDAAVIAWTLRALQSDIERYREWEQQREDSHGPTAPDAAD
jgi:uncharacterized membrane protein YkvA (DUF1232 family)